MSRERKAQIPVNEPKEPQAPVEVPVETDKEMRDIRLPAKSAEKAPEPETPGFVKGSTPEVAAADAAADAAVKNPASKKLEGQTPPVGPPAPKAIPKITPDTPSRAANLEEAVRKAE